MTQEQENAENNENHIVADETPRWYILKVQVNREDHVKRELDRRVKIAGLENCVEKILVPVERVVELKNGRKRETKRKLYPGYIMVKMILNDDTWFLMRDAPGVGDFTGASRRGGETKPLPMTDEDVERMLKSESETSEEQPKLQIPFVVGDRVKITDGTFKDTEGTIGSVDPEGRVSVDIVFLNSKTPVSLEYWQVEKVEVD